MNHKIVHTIHSLPMGNKEYLYIDIPIETHYFHEKKGEVGAWSGRSNLSLVGKNMPNKQFESVDDAFAKMQINKECDPHYQYGIVINFQTKIFYYDNEETAKYWRYHPEKICYVMELKKVEDWTKVPK